MSAGSTDVRSPLAMASTRAVRPPKAATDRRATQATLVDDDDRVGQLEYLGDLGAEDQHAVALARIVAQDAIDLRLAADIDAAGRLLEHQQLRVAGDGRGDGDLLLVAARQRRQRSPR